MKVIINQSGWWHRIHQLSTLHFATLFFYMFEFFNNGYILSIGVRYYWLSKNIQINEMRKLWSKTDVKIGWFTYLNRLNWFARSTEPKTDNTSISSTDTASKYTTNVSQQDNYFQYFDSLPSSRKVIPPLSTNIDLIINDSSPNISSPVISTRCNGIRKKSISWW